MGREICPWEKNEKKSTFGKKGKGIMSNGKGVKINGTV
jgi:hypothetical protein